ncbi:hypothetical protein Acr_23g0012180 [Actinidia rufa]|uniref:Shugoshin C-terminal domain-containing protein n=1 Tax=Actinidia rufa TaxID=165716 RepID=A0A7J0GPW5_9ERIC|nr:hypothetical protein Acr_23g0012180 [Actinidia rufa]
MAKRSSFGSTVRKRLSDITNSIPQTKSPLPQKKLSPTDSSSKEYIDHLVKELNLGKDKLKALQHEILCKETLLKARNLDLELIKHMALVFAAMGPSTTSQQVAEKEASESKRRRLRRQSARYNSQANKPTENLFEIGDANYLVPSSSIKKEKNGENCTPARSQRTSLGRPLRKAAEKVQSYKETPLNIKMRRPE